MKTKLLHAAMLWVLMHGACQQMIPECWNLATHSPKKAGFLGSTKVFVCKSSGAKKYHFNQNCRGLKRCTHEIIESTQKSASAMGLGLCGYEK